MQKLKAIWRQLFDIRRGELGRTLSMFFYLLFVMFAYYILKPVSRAMFLTKFDLDKLPWLYILIAAFGGLLAYFYSKLAARTSLANAVFWSMAISILCLFAIWYLLSIKVPGPKPGQFVAKFKWMIYVFNVWVSLFSVTLVAQGWLVASNIFNPREARRVYGLLGLGLVIGAWCGGEYTNQVARRIGTNNLLPGAAALVIFAYIAFRVALAQKGVSLERAKAVGAKEVDFSLTDMVADVVRTRHLQVIVSIMVMLFIVDTLVDFQFQAMAQRAYQDDELTAFMGRFYGTYLNLTEFIFQFFLTTLIVGRFGVGGAMQVMPGAIALSSLGTALSPGLVSAGIARLTEASTRYSLNRTGLELLYMPLPIELRNRVKAFIDIFVDRLSRGLGGCMLILMFVFMPHETGNPGDAARIVRVVAVVAIALTIPWMLLSMRARREYVATIRKRLASRQLDLGSARLTVEGRETLELLEQAAAGNNPRQAAYALSLLGEAPGYDLGPQLEKLAGSPYPEVRAQVYQLARTTGVASLLEPALRDVRSEGEGDGALIKPAVAYVLAMSPEREARAREWIDSPHYRTAAGVLDALAGHRETAGGLISLEWVARAARDGQPGRRALAAQAVGIIGDAGAELLRRLLDDHDPGVVSAACRAAGVLRHRGYVDALIGLLPHPRLRGDAIEALCRYGPRICGTLGDILEDPSVPLRVRRHLPRILKRIPDHRSIEVLLKANLHPDPGIRAEALKGLNRFRATAPQLYIEDGMVGPQVMIEARSYFELNAEVQPFRNRTGGYTPATDLLARSLEERLRQTLERMFRLLGLKYPPKEIYAAYLAIQRRHAGDLSAALEFLDNVVERDLKRILIPLLDAPHLAQRGKELFGVEARTMESAIRDLIQSTDPWLVACAMAAAAELKMQGLAADIAQAAQHAEAEVCEVARAARAALA